MDTNPEVAIAAAAVQHQIPVYFLRAIAIVESGIDPHALRVEPHYRYLWDVKSNVAFRKLQAHEIVSASAPHDFNHPRCYSRDTEYWFQKTSWGLMQIMGANARAYGLTGAFAALFDPVINLQYSCALLFDLKRRHFEAHGWKGVAAAYNAGAPRLDSTGTFKNQEYVDKVSAAGGFPLVMAG